MSNAETLTLSLIPVLPFFVFSLSGYLHLFYRVANNS